MAEILSLTNLQHYSEMAKRLDEIRYAKKHIKAWRDDKKANKAIETLFEFKLQGFTVHLDPNRIIRVLEEQENEYLREFKKVGIVDDALKMNPVKGKDFPR